MDLVDLRNAVRALARQLATLLVVIVLLYAVKLPVRANVGGDTPHAGTGRPGGESAPSPQPPLRVVLMVNGTLGDKSFYDSAARGLQAARQKLGMRTRVAEAGFDPTRWESTLADLAEAGDFDLIVTGGFAMATLVQRVAPRNPSVRFVLFDAAVDAKLCACPNVHALLFRQNEGAYLAGMLAVRHTQQHISGAAAPVLGVVGAMPIPVIDDFIIGFTAGAHAAAPQAQVLKQYVNSFTDPAAGKEVAKAMFGRGAQLVFHAAAGSGQGVIEAAAEYGRYAIGVDSDQYRIFAATRPQQAAAIVSSVLKNVDVAVFNALRSAQQQTLSWGTSTSLGLAEGGVSLAAGSAQMLLLPTTVQLELQAAQDQVRQGTLQVPSAFATAKPPVKP